VAVDAAGLKDGLDLRHEVHFFRLRALLAGEPDDETNQDEG
jgi:hypothetical protein